MIILSEAIRMFIKRIKLTNYLYPYSGTDEEICKKIINDCYNKEKNYFQVSAGKTTNYPEFYARDFGWCIQSLINLGYKKEVIKTLEYALLIYSKNKGITVAINPSGKTFNFPNVYSPDSIAYFFRSLRVAEAKELILKYSDFLNSEIKKFEDLVIDKQKGIIKSENFSGMRDYEIKEASCYDMIMACVLCDEISKINKLVKQNILENTLKKYNLKEKLIKFYWNGKFFKDGINENILTGHCNVYPYFLDVIKDKKMLNSCIKELIKNNYDKPVPLKYEHNNKQTIRKTKFVWHEFFVSGWEKDAVWAMLGMAYINIVSKINKNQAKSYLQLYKQQIESHKGFIEVYNHKGYPYKSFFYAAENTMLWASIYLDLKRRLKV